MQIKLTTELRHREPQKLAAIALLEDHPDGNIIVHKVTRAGMTTGVIAASADRREKMVVIVPTKKISTSTVLETARGYTEDMVEVMVRCPSNKECIKNKKLISRYPDMEALDLMPIGGEGGGGCRECDHYHECPHTEVLRDDWIVCGLTYHKLYALGMNAEAAKYRKKNEEEEPSISEQTWKEITSGTVNVLLDECHELQKGDKKEIPVAWKTKDGLVRHGLERYYRLMGGDFPHVSSVLKILQRMLDHKNVKEATDALFLDFETKKAGSKKMSKEILNTWNVEEEYEEVGSERDVGYIMDIISETVELMKVRRDYGLAPKDVAELQWYYFLVTSPSIHIHAIREGRSIAVKAVAVNHEFHRMIAKFIAEVQKNWKHKRTILTSATVGSWNYKKLFPGGAKLRDVFFGHKGDPCDTSSRQFIFSDRWKLSAYGPYGLKNKLPEIIEGIKKISAFFGSEEKVTVVAMNTRQMGMLKGEIHSVPELHNVTVTYYKSDDTMGVQGKGRVMILVGIAEKPINSFDAIAPSKEESLRMLEEAVQADTYQALSRCKDPKGEKNSYVFGIGCTYEDLVKCVTWGTERKLIPKDENFREFDVEIKRHLPIPKVSRFSSRIKGYADLPKINKNFSILVDLDSCLSEKIGMRTLSREDKEIIKSYVNDQITKQKYLYNNKGNFSTGLIKNISDKNINQCAEGSQLPKLPNIKNISREICSVPQDIGSENQYDMPLLNGPHLDFFGAPIPIVSDVLVGKYGVCHRLAHNRERYVEVSYAGEWFANSANLSDELIRAHSEGREVIGVYPIKDNGTVGFVCFDIDGHPSIDRELKDMKRQHLKEIKRIEKQYQESRGFVLNTVETETPLGDLILTKEQERAVLVVLGKQCMTDNAREVWRYEEARKQLEATHNDRETCYAAAENERQRLVSFLEQHGIPYMLEASGSPHSYHVWIFLIPTEAARARAFGMFINEKAGTNIREINPKNKGADSQNALKLPFADYSCKKRAPEKVRTKKSTVMHNGEWVTDIREIEIHQLDLSNFSYDKTVRKPTKTSARATGPFMEEADSEYEHVGGYTVRPFFRWAIHQQLEGYQGNKCRAAIVREYYCAGMEDPDELARLFQHQQDFDHETSVYQVKSLLKKEFGPWKKETMEAEFGSILECFNAVKDFNYQDHEYSKAPEIICHEV